jgi:hypothetical protein
MDVYTIGRHLLPVVAGILIVAGLFIPVSLVFTGVRILVLVQRLVGYRHQTKRPAVTINIFPGKQSSRPPMRVTD